jgi:orotate phosphoribosyltransferase
MDYKKRFIKFMCDSNVLKFGDFTLKSGRKAPYFINTGSYSTGEQIARLGEFYAECIMENGLDGRFNLLFGPAYKGIPLCVAAAAALYGSYGVNRGYCFNRKEEKDHGEGGLFIGHKPISGDKVVIIEDVITAGTAMRETLPLLTESGAAVAGIIISVDRMEKGSGDISAVQEIESVYGIPVFAISTVSDIIECLKDGLIEGGEYLDRMYEYRERYGV